MRDLIVSEFVTLDGVMEAPGGEHSHPHTGWVFDYMGPEQEKYKLDETLEAESLLLGRVTYEGFAAAWPERSGEEGDGGPILVAGSSTLVQALIEDDLVDELRLMVFPVLIGGGKRLFPETSLKKPFEPTDSRTFKSGVTVNTYRPAESR